MGYYVAELPAWKKVVEESPARYALPVDLAAAHNRIGWLFFGMGRLPEALEQYEQARAILRKLLETYHPHLLPRTRSDLSNILINIAEIERRRGRLPEAQAHCDEAIAIREGVMKEFPEVSMYRVQMGECLLRSGQVRLYAGDISGAAEFGRRALAFYARLPQRTGAYAAFEAGSHALLSRVAGCSGSGIPAAEGSVEAEKAMAILRRILAEGYRAPELNNESSLEPLRSRPDFRDLMMDTAFPAEPFARSD
jgi:tetratricopeptide (TPR) repeat protein